MTRTPPAVLAGLRLGGILPVYWRRKRASAKWHRGFRVGSRVVRSQCEKVTGLHKGNLIFAPIEEPWPEPHCPKCERATPGTDAVREATQLNVKRPRGAWVTRLTGPRSNANHQHQRKEL